MDKELILWMLIDLQYIEKPRDLRKMALTSKYFDTRLKKSKHLENKKNKILKIARRWKAISSWNKFLFSPNFKILKTETEMINGDGTGLYNFSKRKTPTYRMIAAIWIRDPISNFFNFNSKGYEWILGCGNKIIDTKTFSSRYNEWRKLDFFKGGALYPCDLFVSQSHLYCNSEPFADVKITWVYTNLSPSQVKNKNDQKFMWLTKSGWRWVNKNNYPGK